MSDPRPHLDLAPPRPLGFRNPSGGRRDPAPLPPRDRAAHAAALQEQIECLAQSWRTVDERLPDSVGHLAAAESAPGAELPVSSLGDKRTAVDVVASDDTSALLHVRGGSLHVLEGKVNAYATDETEKGRPRNEPLVAVLERVREAKLGDVAAGSLVSAPIDPDARYWVELWTRGGRLCGDDERARVHGVVRALTELSDPDAAEPVTFTGTERDIHLAQLSGRVLLAITRLAPDVYRVARPADARADRLARDHQGELVDPGRVRPPHRQATVAAILDTGVAEAHPLLEPLFAEPGISVVPGEPSAIDRDGHGTEMASIAAYDDLAVQLLSADEITPRAALENIRCQAPTGTTPLWAARTEEAIEAAESLGPRRRVFNLALSDPTQTSADRTSWSVAVDRLAYDDERGRLITVAIGNAPHFANPADYPAHNMSAFLHDPAQAVNALTVGALTHRDALSAPGTLTPVAQAGQLSPYTSTNASGRLPIKPEIVMEGGNACPDGTLMCSGEADLSVLAADHRHAAGHLLGWTWATSAACASATGLTAEIWAANRTRSPQSIRALLVNAARWTPEICEQHPDRRERLRAVGYGWPQRDIALVSTRQRPTLILENSIAPEQPFANAKRAMHLVTLPLPSDELLALGDHPVELAVTLSYFGEPNEARRVRYMGATLAWDLQRRGEDMDQFVRRVNAIGRPQGQERPNAADPWTMEIGPKARSHGTVQSDRMRTEAASLAGDKHIAVWPIGGWWADHPKTRAASAITYSLVVTIDAGDADIDLHALIDARIGVLLDAT